jgi:hypothetical protein
MEFFIEKRHNALDVYETPESVSIKHKIKES